MTANAVRDGREEGQEGSARETRGNAMARMLVYVLRPSLYEAAPLSYPRALVSEGALFDARVRSIFLATPIAGLRMPKPPEAIP